MLSPYKILSGLDKGIPRKMVLLTDLVISLISISLAYALRHNFDLPQDIWNTAYFVYPSIFLTRLLSFLYAKSYTGIIKYTSTEDLKRIIIALTISSVFIELVNLSTFYQFGKIFIPTSIVIIDYFVSIILMGGLRMVIKITYFETRDNDSEKINVVIYGAGEAGVITKKTMDQDAGSNYNIVGFLDDNPSIQKSSIEGVQIYPVKVFELLISAKKVQLLIIAIQDLPQERKKSVIDICLNNNVKVRSLPPVEKWINGELTFRQIKNVKIEDVLGRSVIEFDSTQVAEELKNKVILVTGGAGSIGSELVRQIARYSPKRLIILDDAETPLHEIELELNDLNFKINFDTVLGDIRNLDRLEKVFKTFKPQIVYHAAAYKHVPVIENNPSEAILTNVMGSKNVADLSIKYHVDKFVMISTDKAVNPTNVMGASKRVAEIYTQALDRHQIFNHKDYNHHTRFITTRFGNVLGSNGSVITRFRKQIAEGGPVTVTHPDITRYFMTIPEACNLVLKASYLGKGGEIFLFDMGESVKIVDLAKKMIKLSGLELGKDIQLIFTGLRPGEKLFEELLNDQENTIPTNNKKILVAKVREYDFEQINKQISELIKLFDFQNNDAIILKMKEIVPEFISKNSVYEKLDKLKNTERD